MHLTGTFHPPAGTICWSLLSATTCDLQLSNCASRHRDASARAVRLSSGTTLLTEAPEGAQIGRRGCGRRQESLRSVIRASCKALVAAETMNAIKKTKWRCNRPCAWLRRRRAKVQRGKAILSGDTSPQRQKTTSRAATVAAQSPKAPVRRSGECQNRKVSDSLPKRTWGIIRGPCWKPGVAGGVSCATMFRSWT